MGGQLGEEFADALAQKDAGRLKSLLRSDLDFRAMTPRQFWESRDSNVVVDDILLGKWFEPSDDITEVVAVETGNVGTRSRVGYRFKVTNADGSYLAEQQAYFEPDGDKIGWLRIICAVFVPDQ